MRLWQQTKKLVRRPSTINVYRRYLGHQQKRNYEQLIGRNVSGAVYSEAVTKARLRDKSSLRRAILGPNGKAHIMAFGLQDWEEHGMWQSFARVSHFEFCNIRSLGHSAGLFFQTQDNRRALAHACLAELDRVDNVRAVTAVFFYIDSESLHPDLFLGLAARGIWSIVMGLDDKHRFYPRSERGIRVGQATLIPHVDLLWTNWRSGAQRITDAGGAAWYAGQGADPLFHRYTPGERDIELLFLGQNYGERAAFVDYLRSAGLPVYAAGRGWPSGHVSFEASIALINRAQIVLGYGATGCMRDVQCLKGRDFEVPMCKAVYLTMYNSELSDWYDIGKEIICYSSRLDCVELARWLLVCPERLESIRAAGQQRALRDHTWETRIVGLLSLFPRKAL